MVETLRITIRRTSLSNKDPMLDFCKMSGIYSSTDKNHTAMRILLTLHKYGELNSTKLSKELKVSRGAILNHLENLCNSGFIFKYGKNYHLREESFSQIVSEIEKDIKKTLAQMREYAKEIDDMFSD